MKSFANRVFSGAGLLLSTAVATASPILLDTEQKAAAGLETALFKAEVGRQTNSLFEAAEQYTDVALRLVAAATTPEALLSAPHGITINCSVSGTLKARLPDAQPRVLHVQWNDCVSRVFGSRPPRLNGPVAITLPADTFQPETLLGIRFGNDANEFTLQFRNESPDQISDTTEAFRLVLRGEIAVWVGTSRLVMNGYLEQRSLVEFPPGTPPVLIDYKASADHIALVRVRTNNDAGTLDDDDTVFERGSFVALQTQPPPYGTFSDAYTFHDYRVHRITDYEGWTDTLSVDGRINVTFNPFHGAGCMSGLYTFKTRVPLLNPLDTQMFASGELVVNGDVVTKFYSAANTPPGLPIPVNGMLINMKVRNVGTFNYDTDNWFTALTPVGACQ